MGSLRDRVKNNKGAGAASIDANAQKFIDAANDGSAASSDVPGIHSRRDKWPSIAYPEELNFTISATLQSTDRRHGIVGQERYHFQLNS